MKNIKPIKMADKTMPMLLTSNSNHFCFVLSTIIYEKGH